MSAQPLIASPDLQPRLLQVQGLYRASLLDALAKPSSPVEEVAVLELARRGYTADFADSWGLGLDDGSLRDRLGVEAWGEVVAAGVVAWPDGRGTVLQNRLTFPIHDWRGGLVGFSGRRLLGDGDKWMYPPNSAAFSRGNFIFNLHRAAEIGAKRNFFVLVEGANDAMTLSQAGIANVVQCLGTTFTRRQAVLLRRFVRRVVLLLDPDVGGDSAAAKGRVLMAANGLEVFKAQLSQWDPDETVRQVGVGPVLEAIRAALRR